MNTFELYQGNCLDSLKNMEDNSVDSIVSDPPYGLSFMGKKWDYDVPSVEIWKECLRVLKPGGHLLAFAGTRTQHRMAVRIEDAGFEIRDMIAWVYGSGFPKSLDVSKAIDKAAGVEFDAVPASGVGFMNAEGEGGYNVTKNQLVRKGESTDVARQWQGWGTSLKPSLEPVTVARKPLSEGTVAANVLAHGTGAINIDGCRVSPTGERLGGGEKRATFVDSDGWSRQWMMDADKVSEHSEKVRQNVDRATQLGRFPANLIHDGSDEVLNLFPITKSGSITAGASSGRDMRAGDKDNTRKDGRPPQPKDIFGNEGSAARFFYCAKVSAKERNAGMPEGTTNNHPTLKPIALMTYLCRLVTPPGGIILDPFMGSGSTGIAAINEGFKFIGCEMSPDYIKIAEARIRHAQSELQKQLDSIGPF